MTKVIITGGAGFIGYHLTKFLLKENYEVTIFDNFSDYYSPKLKELNASETEEIGAKIVNGSILNKSELKEVISKDTDFLVHLAAQPGVRYSTLYPHNTFRTNVEGTSNIISTAIEIGLKRIVLASSSSVFGNAEYFPIDEKHPKNPLSYYGLSKLSTEGIAKIASHLNNDMEINIIRPFTVVGARQRPDMGLNIFITKALKGETITIFGDGEQTRDWTNVDNMTTAFYLAATKKNVKNEDFNIGSGIRISVNKLLDLIAEITDKKLTFEYVKKDEADSTDTHADISKAKRILGYNPIKGLKEAIEDFVSDAKNNRKLFSL